MPNACINRVGHARSLRRGYVCVARPFNMDIIMTSLDCLLGIMKTLRDSEKGCL